MPALLTRRRWIGDAARAAAAIALGLGLNAPLAMALPRRPACGGHKGRLAHVRRTGPHPDPRPGIDASHLPPAEAVRTAHPRAAAAFEEARTIPEILDGIRCQCGCADGQDLRSLLSCYEGEAAMALECEICEGQARLAYRLHRQGRSLDQIRAAVDARYGG
jgi:hypothetical protein